MKTSVFKTAAGRDKFRAYYQGVLSHFPFEQRYIQTGFGQTFLLAAGQPANPPVILLHGSCSNSAFWFPEIMALADDFRVYAVDIIGEAGNSEEYRPELDSDAFAQWLQEVLHGLGIGQAAVIGPGVVPVQPPDRGAQLMRPQVPAARGPYRGDRVPQRVGQHGQAVGVAYRHPTLEPADLE